MKETLYQIFPFILSCSLLELFFHETLTLTEEIFAYRNTFFLEIGFSWTARDLVPFLDTIFTSVWCICILWFNSVKGGHNVGEAPLEPRITIVCNRECELFHSYTPTSDDVLSVLCVVCWSVVNLVRVTSSSLSEPPGDPFMWKYTTHTSLHSCNLNISHPPTCPFMTEYIPPTLLSIHTLTTTIMSHPQRRIRQCFANNPITNNITRRIA